MFRTHDPDRFRARLITGAVLLLALTLSPTAALGQNWSLQHLTRGKVWLSINNSFSMGGTIDLGAGYNLAYPGYSFGSDRSDTPGHHIGAGYLIYGIRDGNARAYTISSEFYPSEQYVFPTAPGTRIDNFNLADPSLPAEQIVTGAHMVRDLMVEVSHRSMVWSFPKYDDFVIHEVTLTNEGETPVTDLHFGTRFGIQVSSRGDNIGPGSLRDVKYGWNDEHEIFYFYDDRSFRFEDEAPIQFNFGPGPQTGDIGDPANILIANSSTAELMSPAYVSSVALDCAGGETFYNITEYLGQATTSQAPVVDHTPYVGADPPSFYLSAITHQQPRMSWDEARAAGGEGGNKYERQPEILTSCGPFTLAPGASVTLTFAEVLGEMDREKIVEGGVENVQLLATASRDSLLANVTSLRELYANGYQIANPPPPTPTDGENSLTLTPVGGGVEITWPAIDPNYVDPVTGQADLAGYRIYRSTYFTTGPWTLVGDVPADEAEIIDGNVVFTDEDLPLGVANYFAVTSYDDAGNESGIVNNNRFPVYPLRAANDEFPRNVYVVPNPFRQNSRLFGANEELRMEFIGLPSSAIIRIYTLTGDLIREIDHDDGSGSAAWGSQQTLDYQTSEWMQYVAPGVYVFHVESRAPGSEGESYIGKFAIIK